MGLKIFRLRQEKQLNQKQLGEKLGYSQRTISDWENCNTEPKIEAIKKLIIFFGITYEELLDDN